MDAELNIFHNQLRPCQALGYVACMSYIILLIKTLPDMLFSSSNPFPILLSAVLLGRTIQDISSIRPTDETGERKVGPDEPYLLLVINFHLYCNNDCRWAVDKLTADGEDVEGQCFLPQYLLFAKICLLRPFGLSNLGTIRRNPDTDALENGVSKNKDHKDNDVDRKDSILESNSLIDDSLTDARSVEQDEKIMQANFEKQIDLPETWKWWTFRTILIQQRLISGPSASLNAALKTLIPMVSQPNFAPLEPLLLLILYKIHSCISIHLASEWQSS